MTIARCREDVSVGAYAGACAQRLERGAQSGAKRGLRRPTAEEVAQSRAHLFRPSMFGSRLEEVMALQRDRFPDRCLPWVQTTLSEAVLRLHGAQTEGIFRVPGDIDEVGAALPTLPSPGPTPLSIPDRPTESFMLMCAL